MIIIYKIFDAHCDTLLKLYFENKSIYDSDCMVSVKKLENYAFATYTMAVFNDGSLKMKDILNIFDRFEKHKNQKNVEFIYAVEGLGNAADFNIKHLDLLKKRDVKFISLTHNNDNFLCGGIENNKNGLTDFGCKTLAKMAECGFILDLSHISDKGFYEAIELLDKIEAVNKTEDLEKNKSFSKKICATHSNSREICKHMRNITDDMFLKIKERNGVCGINLYPMFVSDTYESKKVSSLDIIKHIEHFLSLGGENNIGIGADFDGIDFTPADIKNSADMYILFDNLLKLNYKEDIINKISYINFQNMLNF